MGVLFVVSLTAVVASANGGNGGKNTIKIGLV
jgi:hypothetical protein